MRAALTGVAMILGAVLGIIAAIVAVVWLATPAKAADCGLIRDHDTRNQCEAIRDRSSGNCGLIGDADQRRICYAQTEHRR